MSLTAAQIAALDRADPNSIADELRGIAVGTMLDAHDTAIGELQAETVVAALTGTLTGTANGSLVDVAAAAGSCAGGAEPSAAQVDTAIATAVAPIVSGTNEQLKEIATKLEAIRAALVTAKILASS